MEETTETDDELLQRRDMVERQRDAYRKRTAGMRPGAARDRADRFAGGLEFTLLGIESELRQRGLSD